MEKNKIVSLIILIILITLSVILWKILIIKIDNNNPEINYTYNNYDEIYRIEKERQQKEEELQEKIEEEIEEENILIDEYNIKQLETVKQVLNNLDKNSYSFSNINDFNIQFNQNIKPIDNCYFLSDVNSLYSDFYKHFKIDKKDYNWWYMFWLSIKSTKFQRIYWKKTYVYPYYNFPACIGNCNDGRYWKLDEIINNPCK